MNTDNMSLEQKQALMNANLGGLQKEINASSWSPHMEELIKAWGEKAAGLRWMHQKSATKWKKQADRLTLSGIFITTLVSTASLATAGIEDSQTVMYVVGSVGMIGAIIQSLKKFYNSEEKVAEHTSIAKQFGTFYRNLTLQMGMSKYDRKPSDELSDWALSEYERMQQDAPPIGGNIVSAYKKAFPRASNVPDIAETEFVIKIYRDTEVKKDCKKECKKECNEEEKTLKNDENV